MKKDVRGRNNGNIFRVFRKIQDYQMMNAVVSVNLETVIAGATHIQGVDRVTLHSESKERVEN